MSFYQKLGEIGPKYIRARTLLKYGFNLSPMYRRSCARITSVSDDISNISIKLPLSYRNKNYVGSIFGGSMFAAVDPLPMVQLIYLLNHEYVVWDKSAEVLFKIPAREDLYAEFNYTPEEIAAIKAEVDANKECEIVKTTQLTNQAQSKVFCEVNKTIYIATKAHYKAKLAAKKAREA